MYSVLICFNFLSLVVVFGQRRIAVFIGDDLEEYDQIRKQLQYTNVTGQLSFVRLFARDQFHNANAICSSLRNGTWIMVALCNSDVTAQLQWYSQALHVPLVMMTSEHSPVVSGNTPMKPDSSYQLNMQPPTMRAVIDLVTKEYSWKTALYVTDSNEKVKVDLDQIRSRKLATVLALNLPWFRVKQMTHAMNMYYTYTKTGVLQNLYFTFYMAQNLDRTVDYLMSSVLREKSREWNVILDTPAANASETINRLLSGDFVRERKFHFVLAGLDSEGANFAVLRYTANSLTYLTLVDHNEAVLNQSLLGKGLPDFYVSDRTTSLFALAKDSVQFALATFQKTAVDPPSIQSLDCLAQPDNTWYDGDAMLRVLRETKFDEMTGPLSFGSMGERQRYEFNIVEMIRGGQVNQIGTWNDTYGLKIARKVDVNGKNKTLRVVSFYRSQFLNVAACKTNKGVIQIPINPSEVPNLQSIVGTALNFTGKCYEGYNVDLLDQLAQTIGFQYTLRISKDNEYGKKANGTWTGGVGEVLRRTADLTIGDLSIISAREEVVDYTIPFMNDAYVVMMKQDDKKAMRMFSFLDPFSWTMWLCILLALMITFVIVFVVGRITPSEWHLASRCDPDATNGLINNYSAKESLWLTVATLLQQGPSFSPRAVATKIAVATWFAWAMIVGATYTANLAAFLTVSHMTPTINTIEDLAKQDDVRYGIDRQNIASVYFFQNSRQEIYREMWKKMEALGWICADQEEGTKWIREGKYAYITSKSYVEYINSGQPCDTRTLGLPLFYDNYAIAVDRGSELRKILSEALLRLNENGALKQLETRWFSRDNTDECRAIRDKDKQTDSSDLNSLNPYDLTGLFIILAGGLAISLMVAMGEYVCKRHSKFRRYGISMARILYTMKKPTHVPDTALKPTLSGRKSSFDRRRNESENKTEVV